MIEGNIAPVGRDGDGHPCVPIRVRGANRRHPSTVPGSSASYGSESFRFSGYNGCMRRSRTLYYGARFGLTIGTPCVRGSWVRTSGKRWSGHLTHRLISNPTYQKIKAFVEWNPSRTRSAGIQADFMTKWLRTCKRCCGDCRFTRGMPEMDGLTQGNSLDESADPQASPHPPRRSVFRRTRRRSRSSSGKSGGQA